VNGGRSALEFAVLEHRLRTILEEAADSLKRVSGSPVATEINDMNVALMTRDGQPIMIGSFSPNKATALSSVVTDVVRRYAESPGIAHGDAFLCNDPYVGPLHQNDVAVVAPVFSDGALLAWVGAEIHQVDVGGPTPGQVQLGARDIYGEAPVIPPIKMVERGRIRPDLERMYVQRSRAPDLLALDLRAKLSACHRVRERIGELASRHGAPALTGFFDDLIDYGERQLRRRLRDLPDGTWRHRSYIEYEGELYRLMVALSKTGDAIRVDFSGSAAQAPAGINLTPAGLRANVLGNVTSKLGWGLPRTVAGFARCVEIVTEPGSIVHAVHPAGVCKSTTSTGLMIGSAFGLLVGKMLLGNPAYHRQVMAAWPGAKAQEELHGVRDDGRPFSADILDGMAGGGGARTARDGIDTGGLGGSAKVAIANVEQYESLYPILYLYRRELRDSGGPGQYRGGRGIDRAYAIHGSDRLDVVVHCVGYEYPASAGLAGGRPSVGNRFLLARDVDVAELLRGDGPEAGPTWRELGPVERATLSRGDVLRAASNGGGGYGDPLDRAPDLVLRDLERNAISPAEAGRTYGVVLDGDAVDGVRTARRRSEARRVRAKRAPRPRVASGPAGPAGEPVGTRPLSRLLRLASWAGEEWYACECGTALAPAAGSFKEAALTVVTPAEALAPRGLRLRRPRNRLELREFLCPSCLRVLDSEVALAGDPVLPDYAPGGRPDRLAAAGSTP
jgi:N-methylhydantoinase B